MKKIITITLAMSLSLILSGCGGSDSGTETAPEIPSTPDVPETPDIPTGYEWNIEQWKITLPISRDEYYGQGGESAAELIPADCSGKEWFSNETDLPYFWVDEHDKRMHFVVNLADKGATTTNSDYVRSELRELYQYENGNKCSSSNQNWEITGRHSLHGQLQIEQFPTISGQQPKVIVGQIHGYEIKQALVKYQWEGENTPVRVILNDNFADNNSSDCGNCQSFSVELATVAANTPWSYDIVADKTELTLSMTVNGKTTTKVLPWGVAVEAKDGKKYTLTKDWLNETFYFKAGIYPQIQPNTTYQNQIFEVSFDKINIEHKN
ncbi:polysaccharide lyase family 7 protein [Shewanella intestini]|uniref:Polysaccharide lyase family 7 protein n=1 Tax=Shewanella intestini TaxID=2017544 RepID=A0ABS5I6F8_9GAMM|nr:MULTISPECIES: polysaccharide lyase family 7 protein [Shewanella]MBR9728915.1 polysaccharide lyase family 7 protein [Shewanella intestini]MRG37019.1 polysaccharide lyase family 7 protein [Shewanella sp. XMDDZSB0408]